MLEISPLQDNGIYWVADNEAKIAAVVMERACRLFKRGIRSRCNGLLNRYLRNLVPVGANDFVINFGANIGEVSIALAERGANVLAIEPDPNVIPALLANAANSSIDVEPVAAWNSDGLIEMYIATAYGDTSAFPLSPERVAEQRLLSARRIDTLVQDRGIDRVRLIVGDAEGAEPEVLEGARETLKITDYVSVCASAERCGESTLEACEAILKAAQFDTLYRETTGFCVLIASRRS